MDSRKAKIVCTTGPSSSSPKVLRELIKNGMDVARLNFSHADHKTHEETLKIIRKESSELKKNIAILQDLQGIKIRISEIKEGGFNLKTGEKIFIYPGNQISSRQALFISYPALLKDVKEGDRILIDDGLIQLQILSKNKKALEAKAVEGGFIKSKKGANLPYSKTTLTGFTEKDKIDLEFGINLGVDYVAISFVRTANDIEQIIRWAKQKNLELPPLIAKIEKSQALENIEEIMDIVDGIMVARGDLGVEMRPERVPLIQKNLISLANKKGKLVITATQMLESMTEHTRPTRAEASDVANAVLDGTDALMLSAETASGLYPVEAVKMMDKIIKYTEKEKLPAQQVISKYQGTHIFPEAVAEGACEAARAINAKAIVVFTHSGFAAKLISKLRPSVPIIAFTPDQRTLNRLPLYWGVTGHLINKKDAKILDAEFMIEIEKSLIRDNKFKKGDSIVFVASSPFLGEPNIIRLQKL
ncbi:MAG: pyruvate kinase [Thermodesulfovibrionales bacterium]|nr:pyruvate kinase [Thermodesulfovibrionales bacterium]